jgi:hypothetical protein
MTFIAMMFGVTEQYSIDVSQMVVALWFFSVGYFLYKRANRGLTRQRAKSSLDLSQADLSCLTARTYRTTGT